MATQSKGTKQELVVLAREQSDVLAFADRNREIEEIPVSLENGFTARRKRGNRTDRDCIDEICELIAQGVLVMSATRYVGVPYATWHKWIKLNHEQAREKYEFAYTCHLEAMADRTIQIYEELKAQRETEMAKFLKLHDAWCKKVDALDDGEKQPREPKYRGPIDWELALAEKRVAVRKWQLELRHSKFQRKHQIENTLRADVTISHEINLNRDPRATMQEYIKMIEAHSD